MKFLTCFLVASTIFLVGCAQQWSKPGASESDFNTDRFACLQSAQQSQTSFAFNKYSAAANSGMQTNTLLFNACMSSRGYTLTMVDPSGKPVNPPPANTAMNEDRAAFEAKARGVCTSSEFSVIFAATTCNSKDIQFQHLANETTITPEQKAIFPKVRAALDSLNQAQIVFLAKYGGEKGRRAIAVSNKFQSKADQNNLDLYTGQITWGTYNKQRRDMLAQMNAAL